MFKGSSPSLSSQELKFDGKNSMNFTISELRNIKKEERDFIKDSEFSGNMPSENTEDKKPEETDLSDEEVDDILFGKR